MTKLRWSLPFLLVHAAAFSQSQPVPPAVMSELADDLSKIQAQVEASRLVSSMSSRVLNPAVTLVETTTPTIIRSGASPTASTIGRATTGQKFEILDKSADWYAVRLSGSSSTLQAGWLPASDVVPISTAPAPNASTQALDQYRAILDSVNALRTKYRENPYVEIQGFDITIGAPPSISVSFGFKK